MPAEEVKLSRVISCNQDLADTCEQVVIGHPDRHTALDRVQLSKRGPTLRSISWDCRTPSTSTRMRSPAA